MDTLAEINLNFFLYNPIPGKYVTIRILEMFLCGWIQLYLCIQMIQLPFLVS